MLHFFDVAVANAWRIYKIHCQTAHVHEVFDSLQFKLQVADDLTNSPDRPGQNKILLKTWKVWRLKIRKMSTQIFLPRDTDRCYEYYPVFDEIENPRSCRMEGCTSRSKIRCEKCNVYLCLNRKGNCFTSFHKQ